MAAPTKKIRHAGGTRRPGAGKSLQAKLIKSNKTVKGRRIAHRQFPQAGQNVARETFRSGVFRIVADGRQRLSANQLEASRRILRKSLAKGITISVVAYPFAPVTRRPQDVRMGKGKGTRIRRWICPIRPGHVLFDIVVTETARQRRFQAPQFRRELELQILSILRRVGPKLPIAVRFVRVRQ